MTDSCYGVGTISHNFKLYDTHLGNVYAIGMPMMVYLTLLSIIEYSNKRHKPSMSPIFNMAKLLDPVYLDATMSNQPINEKITIKIIKTGKNEM